jgi:flagellar hook assembly protein FlgD
MPFEIVSVAPNPFNPSTTIRFSLPQRMPVTAEVWSVTGARVRVLAKDRAFTAGQNELRWDGRNDAQEPVASGVYFVRVSTELGEKVTRAVLLK